MPNTGYYDLITEIEYATVPLVESIDILALFEELLWNASQWLDPSKPYTIELFNNRLKSLISMHAMVLRDLGNANREVTGIIKTAYQQHANECPHNDS